MAAETASPALHVGLRSTTDGVTFGVLESVRHSAAPTLFVLASTPERTLGDRDYLQSGITLCREGYLCVSLDLPCHGKDSRPGEPLELDGWRHRLEAGDDFVEKFCQRASTVLDHLISTGEADPERVAVCGTSRGGLMALHWAARDKRVRCVVAMSPVTRLTVLKEFQGMQHPERAEAISANSLVDRLIDRNIWIAIGDRDLRVGTDEAIAFARRFSTAVVANASHSKVDLLVLTEPRGHCTPPGAPEQSAVWINKQLEIANRE